jgi:hypothetical protein
MSTITIVKNPAQTDQKIVDDGLSRLSGGDELVFGPGEWNARVNNRNGRKPIPSGTASRPTLIRAQVPYLTVLKPIDSILNDGWYYVVSMEYTAKHVMFDGLIADGSRTDGPGWLLSTQAALPTHYILTDITVQNARVLHCRGSGIGCGAHNNPEDHARYTFRNVELAFSRNTEEGGGYGLYLGSKDCIVEDCPIHDNEGYGIHAYDFGPTINNNLIQRCLIERNGFIGYPDGVIIAHGNNNRIKDCTIRGNAGNGVRVGFDSVGTIIENSKITGNGMYGVDVDAQFGTPRGTQILRNDLGGNGWGEYRNDGQGTIFIPGSPIPVPPIPPAPGPVPPDPTPLRRKFRRRKEDR